MERRTTDPTGLPGPVVVGFDGSHTAVRALTWSARQARRRGAPLVVVVAWRPAAVASADDLRRQHAERIAGYARALLRQLGEPEDGVVLARGPAAGALLAHADGAFAVVVGRRHLGPVGRSLGTVTQTLAAHSGVPVVVVGPHVDTARLTRPVLSVTRSHLDDAALDWAVERARTCGEALHVIDTFQRRYGLGVAGHDQRACELATARLAHDRLVHWIQRRYPGLDVTSELHDGRSREVLPRVLLPDDLLVVAAAAEEARPPLASSPCAVVLVPRARARAAFEPPAALSLPGYAERILHQV